MAAHQQPIREKHASAVMKMRYLGSKRVIADEIVKVIMQMKFMYQSDTFVDLFCGGCNLIDHIPRGAFRVMIANDIHSELIAMWKALQHGWIPPENVTKEEYTQIRTNPHNYPAELVGFVGFCCSFGSIYFSSFAKSNDNRNYAYVGKKNVLKQIVNLKRVRFINYSYDQVTIPDNAIVYCDPPYKNTIEYNIKFDHDQYYRWAKNSKQHLLLSEYNMPKGFQQIREWTISTSIDHHQPRTERLWIPRKTR